MNQPKVQTSEDLPKNDIDSVDSPVESFGIIKKTGRRIAKYSAYIFVSTMLLKGIVFIQSVVVARLLGPGNLGMLSIVTSTGGLFSAVSGFGMASAIVRIIPEYRLKDSQSVNRTLTTFFWLSIITTLPILGLYSLLNPLIAVGLYNEPQLIYLIYLWIIGALLRIFSSMFGPLLQALQKIGLLAKISIVLGTIGAGLSITMVWFYGLPGALYASIISATVVIGIYSFVLRSKARSFLKSLFIFDRTAAARLLRVGGGVLLAGIFFVVATWYGMTILSVSGDFKDIGYYRVAYGVSTLVLTIPAAISTPFYPIIVESYSKDLKESQVVLLNTSRYTMIFTFPICLAFVFLSHVYIEVLYSKEFLAAVPLVAIVAGYSFLRSYNAITNYIFLITERMSIYSVRNGIWFAGLFLMMTLIVPAQLGMGLVLVYFIMRALIISLDPFFFGKEYRLLELIKQSLVCIILGFIIAVSSHPLEHIGLLYRTLLFLGGIAVYGIMLHLVVLSPKDKEFISGLFKSMLEKTRRK